MPNIKSFGLTASEEKSFENVDRRTTDTCLSYKLTFEPSAQVSLKRDRIMTYDNPE